MADQLVHWSRDPCAPSGDPVPGETAAPHTAGVNRRQVSTQVGADVRPGENARWAGGGARLARWKGLEGRPEGGFQIRPNGDSTMLAHPPSSLPFLPPHPPPAPGKSPSSLSRTLWSQTSEFMKT